MKNYLLPAVHTSQKSFYGKACVTTHENGTRVLTSYSTEVAEIDSDDNLTIHGYYSATTSKHIKEFILQELGLKNDIDFKTIQGTTFVTLTNKRTGEYTVIESEA